MSQFIKKETLTFEIEGDDSDHKPSKFNLRQNDPQSVANLQSSREGSVKSDRQFTSFQQKLCTPIRLESRPGRHPTTLNSDLLSND